MKKLLTITFLLLMGWQAEAQVFQSAEPAQSNDFVERASERVAKGVKPYAKVFFVAADYVGEYTKGVKDRVGYAAEVGLQIPFKKRCFGLQTALRYITKGAKAPYEDLNGPLMTIRQNTLEVPVLFTMFIPTGSVGGLKMGMGSYLAYGLDGQATYQGESGDVFGTDDDGLRRFDVGVGFEVSWETRHFSATMGMEAGFIKIAPVSEAPRNRAFYVGVGYIF